MRTPLVIGALAAFLGGAAADQVKYVGTDGITYCVLDNGASLPCDEIGCGKRGDKPCKRILPKDAAFTLKSSLDTYATRLNNNEVPSQVTIPRADFKYQVSLNDNDDIYTVAGHKATDCECWDRNWYYCLTDSKYKDVSCSWVNQYVDLRFALSDSEAADVDSPVTYFRTSGGTNKGDQWRFDFRYQFDILYGGQLVMYPIASNQVPSLYAALAGSPVQINMKCHVPFLNTDVSGYMMVQFTPTPYSPSMDDLQTYLDTANYKFREMVRFNFPALPEFTLPPFVNTSAGSHTYGEQCLNCVDKVNGIAANPFVVLQQGSAGAVDKVQVDCTGTKMTYWGEDSWWYDSFLGNDGYLYRTTRLFYADNDVKLISSVYREEWYPQLEQVLWGRILQQDVTCTNQAATVPQYLYYEIGGGNQTDCGYVGGDMFCLSAAPGLSAGFFLPLLATVAAAAGAWQILA